MISMTRSIAVVFSVLLLSGCAILQPTWHDRQPLKHVVEGTAVLDGRLSVHGEIKCGPPLAFSDYGIKVRRAVDDTGRHLELKSVQVFWMKVTCFEIELTEPDPSAKTVSLDLLFLTRTGLERITKTYPIQRDVQSAYWTQLGRWNRPTNEGAGKKQP